MTINDAAEDAKREPAVAVFAPAAMLHVELEHEADDNIEMHLHPGGQGFWVARMASSLGASVTLCAPFGGEVGTALRHLIAVEGINIRDVPMSNGVMLVDRSGEHPNVLLENPPAPLGRHEIDDLYTTTLGAATAAGVCVVAGSHHANVMPADSYRRLVADLVNSDVAVIVDLSGEALQAALEGRPTLIKISHDELVRDGFTDRADEAGVLRGIAALRDAGAHDIVVSCANDPAIVASGRTSWRVDAPRLEVVEHRGAGDSMTAALATAIARGLVFPDDAVRLAAAAGAVSVTRHGFATGHADTIVELSQRVTLEEITQPRQQGARSRRTDDPSSR